VVGLAEESALSFHHLARAPLGLALCFSHLSLAACRRVAAVLWSLTRSGRSEHGERRDLHSEV
jgi:hypothetical protein